MPTLRDVAGLPSVPASIRESAIIVIDCQNTYREGVMQLEGVENALQNVRKLLDRARAAGVPIFHIQHDAGVGSPYDLTAANGEAVRIHAASARISKSFAEKSRRVLRSRNLPLEISSRRKASKNEPLLRKVGWPWGI